MHYNSYRFKSLLRILLYVQITRDSSQCEVSLYTHYQGSTTGHATPAYHRRVRVLRATEAGSIAALCNAPFTTCQGGRAGPRQSLPPSGTCRAPVYYCAFDTPSGPHTPQQSMWSLCRASPSPHPRELWASLGCPPHWGSAF